MKLVCLMHIELLFPLLLCFPVGVCDRICSWLPFNTSFSLTSLKAKAFKYGKRTFQYLILVSFLFCEIPEACV